MSISWNDGMESGRRTPRRKVGMKTLPIKKTAKVKESSWQLDFAAMKKETDARMFRFVLANIEEKFLQDNKLEEAINHLESIGF